MEVVLAHMKFSIADHFAYYGFAAGWLDDLVNVQFLSKNRATIYH